MAGYNQKNKVKIKDKHINGLDKYRMKILKHRKRKVTEFYNHINLVYDSNTNMRTNEIYGLILLACNKNQLKSKH